MNHILNNDQLRIDTVIGYKVEMYNLSYFGIKGTWNVSSLDWSGLMHRDFTKLVVL